VVAVVVVLVTVVRSRRVVVVVMVGLVGVGVVGLGVCVGVVTTGVVISPGWPFPHGQSLRWKRSLGTCAHVATASPVPGALQTKFATLSLWMYGAPHLAQWLPVEQECLNTRQGNPASAKAAFTAFGWSFSALSRLSLQTSFTLAHTDEQLCPGSPNIQPGLDVVDVGVVVTVVVVGLRKFSPSHIIPFGHGAHKSSPGVAGKYHFNPVCASPFASSTGGAVQVQGVSAALFRL